MLWYLLLGAVIGITALTLLLPTTRRLWIFHLTALRYVQRWLGDRLGLRALACKLSGRPYRRLTGPFLLRRFCEDMGPTYIKFAQIVASSAGMFPEHYVIEFQKCLDRVRPFEFVEVERILRQELGEDKAAQLGEIDPEPLASASIAQVHTARLEDGTNVVIKVQRPGGRYMALRFARPAWRPSGTSMGHAAAHKSHKSQLSATAETCRRIVT